MGYIKIVNILDKSTSMCSLIPSSIKGYNTFIESQMDKPDTMVSTMFFSDSDKFTSLYENELIGNVKPLNVDTYKVDGSTALFDAIGDVINTEIDWLGMTPPSERPEKTLCVILTDGEENSSYRYKKSTILNMVTDMRENYKWEFIFLGASESAVFTASEIGISTGNSYKFDTTNAGIDDAYNYISYVSKQYRDTDDLTTVTSTYKKGVV